MNLPNKLTILRLILTPFIIAFLYIDKFESKLISLILFIIAMITDIIDGKIAKKRNLTTTFGTFLDPLVDKILLMSLFIAFTDLGLIPVWMVLILVAREFFVSALRTISMSKGKIIAANWMGKTKALLQTITISIILLLIALEKTNIFSTINLNIRNISYSLTFIIVLVSIIFALRFFNLNKELITKDV